MKKYKANYMFTLMFRMCTMLLTLCPGIIIMWLLLNPQDAIEALYIFPGYGCLVLFFTVLGNVIHFLISLFTKHTVYIDEKSITLQGKRILTQCMSLEDVKYVIFDHGEIRKYGGGTPCSITLYDIDYDKCLTITNPSFLLICELQKRLKHAAFKFNNYKWYIIFACGFTVFDILICFVALFA